MRPANAKLAIEPVLPMRVALGLAIGEAKAAKLVGGTCVHLFEATPP